jgi:hypothetical protein
MYPIIIMSECNSYDMEWSHFLIPSKFEFYKLCDSYDKTYMFLVAFIRFIFYFLIFQFLHSNGIIEFNEHKSTQYFFFNTFLIINIISFIFMVMVTVKKQSNVQKQVKIEIEIEPSKSMVASLPIEVIKDDLSATDFERSEVGL